MMPDKQQSVTVHYGNQRIRIPVDLNETLERFIEDLIEKADIKEKKIKLFYAGKRLKGRSTSLAKFGLKNNSKVLCIKPHKKQLPEDEKEEKGVQVEEQNPAFSRISDEIQAIDQYVSKDLTPIFHTYVHESSDDKQKKYKQKLMANELLLQQLLKVDGVDVMGSEKLREKRKTLVAKIQKMLDDIDETSKKLSI
ncbi:BAG family molecular chaperone regulator Bag101 [Schizosaccharomyces cryophilus OY26]|uniref:BAG family molecular chaperone regulator Bag101 n=1 Tax=Schizosaccharomyces cryophilus (strain OY26 / ATCC MYA-4695 / CBS 11777 / NBRC 106824 / NRRL Y48691) TaxID=653667 RepID=S9VVQ0_SCHCR|nr:BAG family molecular chaperone regulator Bag101 [Schizosaccharomyces cryophilus OY26]EPY50274.1 BAG family molecular chaperone regulator Bag101 [Schizosaccharomyces cryophilus OY26]